MKKVKTNSKKGFTIIEVVLVLAIAGLIFLMVFVALPNLQRTQRDTQRRDDVARLSTSLTQYITNNNKMPANTNELNGTFKSNYLTVEGDTFNDPLNDDYTLDLVVATNNGNVSSNAGNKVGGMTVITNAKCDTDNKYTFVKGSRRFAIIAKLEGSGYYCSDNN